MTNYKEQEGVERYCPVCDAHDIFVLLERTENKDKSIEVECPKCGYKRTFSKEELSA
ncbi:MAG: hypothetical protein PUC65_13665 [Clostridiales bacterium]|nr:hypothetical protein [Clostridiales bacterium]